MTIMVTELVLSTLLFVAILAQMLPRPALKRQPVVVRRVVRSRNCGRPFR